MDKAEALIEVLRAHDVDVPRTGNVACPWHVDNSPSMSIDRERGLYKCHSCGRGGDVYTFLETTYEVGFDEAEEMLEESGVALEIKKSNTESVTVSEPETNIVPVPAERIEHLESCLIEAERLLWTSGGEALTYLRGRGLTDETVRAFRLGLGGPQMGQHEGRLVIPYLSPQRKPVSLRVRCIEDHAHVGHGKYAGMAGDKTRMFNTNAVLDNPTARVIAVCEGEIDTMTLAQLGVVAVGFPGVNNVKPHHLQILRSFDRVVLLGDNDEAGRNFTDKMMGWINQAIPIRVDGDVNDHYRTHGGEDLLKKIGGKVA